MSDQNQLPTRGRGNLQASYEVTDRGVTVRLDDARSPEFWAEIQIPYTVLWTILSQVEAKQGGAK